MSDAQGITAGDFVAEVSSSATGGAGGSVINEFFGFTGGNGGDAFATATGSNNGLSSVTVSSSASGGAGGSGHFGFFTPDFGIIGGNGGNASATATGSNAGLGSVTVSSSAISGAAGNGLIPGFLTGPDGISGNATAISTASGLGAVSSTAAATANFHTAGSAGILNPVFGGDALAHATATGQSGSATATAQTGGGIFTNVSASSMAPVETAVNVESRASVTGAAPSLAMAAGLQSAAFVTTGLRSSLPVTASIVQGASSPGSGSAVPETFHSEVNLSMELGTIMVGGNLQIHFIDSAVTGAGFDMLTFQIYKEGAVIENDVFTNLISATAFFMEHTLDFGPADQGVTGPLDLRFVFNLTGSQPGDGFAVSYTADINGANNAPSNVPGAVPEPAITALLLGGLALFIFLRCRMRIVRDA
jgi:hypothetical protein